MGLKARRAPALFACAALALALLAGCGGDGDDESLLGPAGATTSTSAGARAPAALPTTGSGLLRALAGSVRAGDRDRYAALLGGDATFRARQIRLFDNLRRLPVDGLSFRRDGAQVVRTLRLGTYDDAPEVGPSGLRIGRVNGRAVALPDPDHPARDPWDLATVRAVRSDSALVVSDVADDTRGRALLAATESAIGAVESAVPLSWRGQVVVYAFRDPAVLASYSQVPGGDLRHLGGLSYPLRDPDGAVTGARVAVLPAALDASEDQRAKLLRHELTHVAVGSRDDDVPTWLAEGLAEHVADTSVPTSQRRIATSAVDAARAGTVTLPDAASFNGADQALHYAVAAAACDVVADQGGDVLWRLLDAMHDADVGRDGTGGPGQGAVLRQVTGLDPDQLARRAADRILRLYG